MTEELQFIVFITLLFLLGVFGMSLKHNQSQYDKEMAKREPKISKKTVQKSDEVIDTLDWMLANSIISPQEYTKLVGKCLPFLQ